MVPNVRTPYVSVKITLAISRRSTIASWFVFSAHDAAHECEGAKFLNREGHKQSGDPMKAALDSAQCIATDDPRLKGK